MPRFTESSCQKVATLIRLLDRRLLHPFYARAKYGLSSLQINLLLLLAKDNVFSMSEIAYKLDISKPNVTPIVDRLISNGYISRTPSEQDRRIINIQATEKGKKMIRTIRSDMKRSFDERFAALTDEQFNAFMDAMDVCIETLNTLEN